MGLLKRTRHRAGSRFGGSAAFAAASLEGSPGLQGEPAFIGYIDKIGDGTVQGWAADRSDLSTRVIVRVYLDDRLVAEDRAADERLDVRDAGFGDGRHGFLLMVPKMALFCATTLTLAVVRPDATEAVCERRDLRPVSAQSGPAIYLDASDLVEFLTTHREVSGIQRVQAGYLLGLGNTTIAGMPCRICARLSSSGFYHHLSYERLSGLLADAGNYEAVPAAAWPHRVRSFTTSLTSRVHLTRGDVVFTVGAPWALESHSTLVRCAKRFYGARYLQIFYDLIPISTPEVVPAPLIQPFARAMATMSAYADHIYAISRHSQDDLSATLTRLGRPTPPTSVVPMGGNITTVADQATGPAKVLQRLGLKRPFVLCVGTLEPRKNHLLLFHVWRRLAAKHGAEDLPRLVFVGRVGWYMEDFMRQLKATNYVDHTIVHLQGVSNAILSDLYESCLFTVFPSFSEGWGLPITESLARGKVCVCSNLTSMPEAGGKHALYIDPYNVTEAFSVCERLIRDDDYRAEREALARRFIAPSWTDAAERLRGQCAEFVARLASSPAVHPRKPIVLGHVYRFRLQEATDAPALETFRHYLDQEDALELLVGWHWFDVDVACIWASGPQAELSLALPETHDGFVVYVELLVPPAYLNATCDIVLDGTVQGRIWGTGCKTVGVAISSEMGGEARLGFSLGGDRGSTDDKRLLGIGISSLAVFRTTDLPSRLHYLENRTVERLCCATLAGKSDMAIGNPSAAAGQV